MNRTFDTEVSLLSPSRIDGFNCRVLPTVRTCTESNYVYLSQRKPTEPEQRERWSREHQHTKRYRRDTCAHSQRAKRRQRTHTEVRAEREREREVRGASRESESKRCEQRERGKRREHTRTRARARTHTHTNTHTHTPDVARCNSETTP